VARLFIPITEKQRGRLIFEVKDSLNFEKRALLELIKYYEAEEAAKGTSRERWLKHVNEIYEGWLKKALSEPRDIYK
jgi:ABC-type proline/glycine betaine transport system substrate-binding protein